MVYVLAALVGLPLNIIVGLLAGGAWAALESGQRKRVLTSR